VVDTAKSLYATGRRKDAVARVWLTAGESGFTVNGKPLEERISREDLRMIINQPFEAIQSGATFSVKATAKGGGIAGQAGALRHGISRALALYDEGFRVILRKGGFLTRDPRKKERKKFGQKGARRSFQFTKR